jgi:hypothetical protein
MNLSGGTVLGERPGPDPAFIARVRRRDRLVDVAEGLEHRVRRRRIGDVVASPGEGPEAHLDHLVRAVAHHHLLGLDA